MLYEHHGENEMMTSFINVRSITIIISHYKLCISNFAYIYMCVHTISN